MEYCPWRKNLRVTRANVEDLAAASALSVATIRRAELKENQTALTSANDLAIRRALESAGVEFIDENGGGPGVGLRHPGACAYCKLGDNAAFARDGLLGRRPWKWFEVLK